MASRWFKLTNDVCYKMVDKRHLPKEEKKHNISMMSDVSFIVNSQGNQDGKGDRVTHDLKKVLESAKTKMLDTKQKIIQSKNHNNELEETVTMIQQQIEDVQKMKRD